MRLVPVGVWVEECEILLDIQLRARSSLFRKFDCIVSNGVGTIDGDYRDEIMVPLYNVLESPVIIPGGTGIAQLVIVSAAFQHMHFRNEEIRRKGGFGSTDLIEETEINVKD